MIDRLLSQSPTNVLEQTARFQARRHTVLADNLVNVSTPGYRQKDLDVEGFRDELRRRLSERDPSGAADLRRLATGADQGPGRSGLVFHDGNNRSAEELLGDQAKNALRHNMNVELLRKHYSQFHMALRERVA
jgi:flagellar basal-body rod protein FlgB